MEREKTEPRKRPVSQVLASVRETLHHTELGLSDLQGNDAVRQRDGLRNLIVNGRSLTFPLQVLRDEDDTTRDEHGHGAWYRERIKERLRDDPAARFFVHLRNLLEKEGILAVTRHEQAMGFQITNLSSADLNRIAPPGTAYSTVGFDGRVRFHRSDASVIQVISRPEVSAIVVGVFTFDDTPPELANRTVGDLAAAYVQLLRDIVKEAEARFGHLP
jgi:hypothetical protein